MKNNNAPVHTTTIVRNNIIFRGFHGKHHYGCELSLVGGGRIGTIMYITPHKVAGMSNEEFMKMLERHCIEID